jgi:hypothetical protein
MEPGDKLLICRDCNSRFLFGRDQQRHFAERAWADPTRCVDCRHARKASIAGFTDGRRQCQACGQEFRWPAIEQASFARPGWTPPHKCAPCRRKARGDSNP